MLMNDMGDDSLERQRTRIWRNAATLAGLLSAMAAMSGVAAAVLPGLHVALRVLSGAPAAAGAVGVWAAVRGYRGRTGMHLVLAFACALASTVTLAVLRRAG